MLDLFVDIENCPVFPQIVRAAQRHALDVYVVTRDYLKADANTHLIFADEDRCAGREWIAANISRGDICVTGDAALASNCLLRGAIALAPAGWAWTSDVVNATRAEVTPGISASTKQRLGTAVNAQAFARHLDAAIAVTRASSRRSIPPQTSPHQAARAVMQPWLLQRRAAVP